MDERHEEIAGLIPEHVLGNLSVEDRDIVERHLPGCEHCRDLLETAHELRATWSAGEAALVYPGRLSDNQRELADRYLSSVPPDQRQAILDELEGRIQSERKGMNLLYDEMRFMYSLCKALKNGEFRSNLGIKVYEDRLARERARQQQALAQRQQCIDPGSEVIHKRMEVRKRSLAEIKKTQGKRSQGRQDNSTGDA